MIDNQMSTAAAPQGGENSAGQAQPAPAKGKGKAKGKKQKVDTDNRERNFATVVYPESAPPDWKQKLNDLHIATLISPLHDKDINPDGGLKKPHYHVMLMFDGKKNFDTQVKPIFDMIGGVGREIIGSKRGYARYMCHMDNPEKHQYSPSDVVALGGADYQAIIHLPGDDGKMLRDIQMFIRANQIFSFAEFMDIAGECNEDWYSMVATNKAYIVEKYIRSLQWEDERGYERKADRPLVDCETGEVIT